MYIVFNKNWKKDHKNSDKKFNQFCQPVIYVIRRRHALQYFPCSSPVSYIRFRLKSFSFSSYSILHTTLIVNNQSMFCHSHHTVTKESLIKKNQNSVINFGNNCTCHSWLRRFKNISIRYKGVVQESCVKVIHYLKARAFILFIRNMNRYKAYGQRN